MTYQRKEIEALVRQLVTRTLANVSTETAATPQPTVAPTPTSSILDAETVQQLPAHSVYNVAPGTVITPLAREAALERHIQLHTAVPPLPHIPTSAQNVVALGADHGGYALKEQLKAMLQSADLGYTVVDCGTHNQDAVDYPDYAYAVAQLVANGRAWRGIMIDGAGIGSCMVANKVPGVRAAMCYDQATAVNSREHNNANVLTLGAGLIGPALANQIVKTWLNTDFGGGRHAKRVAKIEAIGNRFSKPISKE